MRSTIEQGEDAMKTLLFTALLVVSQGCLGSIGISTEYYDDATRARRIETKILYPTNTAESGDTVAENAAFYGFNAVEDAEIAGKQLPIYILVHGTSGNWRNLSWLASQLAESGALVVSANHPNYTSGQATPDSVIRMWDQPLDVSFLIDQVLSGNYGAYVDPENITVIGYSLGGYSALASAGARLDMSGYREYCRQNQDESCQYFANAISGLTEQEYSKISQDYRDPRASRVVAIAPGFVPAVRADSLNNLSATTLIVGAELDEHVPPRMQLEPYLNEGTENLTYEVIPGAYHFSFMQLCKPEAVAILAEEGAEFVCQEPSGRDRDSIHTQLFQLINRFR